VSKRHGRNKAKFRAEKEKDRKIATITFLIIILSCVAVSSYLSHIILGGPSRADQAAPQQFKPENTDSGLKAAIVDQVSLSFSNQTFVQSAVAILEGANYSVDYYRGGGVTVDFFRNLGTHDYDVIILRVHSTATGSQGKESPVVLFTSELYSSNKYVSEQLKGELEMVSFTELQPPTYFAITPTFVVSAMRGSLDNATVIMMGCEGLSNTKMAEAFIDKGAKTYISCYGSVSESYADQVTIQLLQHLVSERQTVEQAVQFTMSEAEPSSAGSSNLGYYPFESGEYTIQK
jgi:hypothetical protein